MLGSRPNTLALVARIAYQESIENIYSNAMGHCSSDPSHQWTMLTRTTGRLGRCVLSILVKMPHMLITNPLIDI